MRRQRLLIAYYYFIGLYTAVLFGLGFALFNVEVGTEKLPIIYVIFPFLDAITAVIMIKTITRKGLKRFFILFLATVACLHLMLVPIYAQLVSGGIFYGIMLVAMIAMSENLLFTRTYLVQEVLTLEELKKWIPIAISFGAVGALTGGVMLRLAEGRLPASIIFILTYPVFLMSVWIAIKLFKEFSVKNTEIFSKRRVTVRSIWKYSTGQIFLPLLIFCVAIIAISDTVNEYFFHYYSTKTLGSLENITGFLGVFLALRYSLELVLNVFVYHRLVKKIGSINIMPLLLIAAAAGLATVSLSEYGLAFALLGRIISTVAVIGMMVYLLEVFYQLLDPLYRPSLVTVVGYIDAFSGYAIGGGILLLHTQWHMSRTLLVAFLAVLLLILAVVWSRNKRGFIDILNASQSVELTSSVEELIGSSDTTGVLRNLLEEAKRGSRSERLFLLYAIKKKKPSEQVTWLSELFDISEMEIRVAILEHIFEKRLFEFSPDLYAHELNDEFKNWLVVKCFINYPYLRDKLIYSKLREVIRDTPPKDEATRQMMRYMFEEIKSAYEPVLTAIDKRNHIEDEVLLGTVIKAYGSMEQSVHIAWFSKGKIYTPEVNAAYDAQVGYRALMYFAQRMDYLTIQSVVGAYDHEVLEQTITGDTISHRLCVAQSQCHNRRDFSAVESLTQMLIFTLNCKQNVKADHLTAELVGSELNKVIYAIEAVLVNHMLEKNSIKLMANSYDYIVHPEKKQVLIEMIRGVRKDTQANLVIDLLERNAQVLGHSSFAYEFGDADSWLETLIEYNRGGRVNAERKKEIDFMIALKSIPMFETLDIDTLKKLTEIVTVGYLNSGDTIVQRGEPGKKFYMLMKGSAAVYVNEKEPPIAKINEGEMIGELGVINNDMRTATVKADGPVELLSMEGDAFLELVKKNSAISMAVIKMLSFRLTGMLRAKGR